MMKITSLKIYLEPKENQQDVVACCLVRDERKLWRVTNPDNTERGLYSGEIRLAGLLQEVIEKFNSGQK